MRRRLAWLFGSLVCLLVLATGELAARVALRWLHGGSEPRPLLSSAPADTRAPGQGRLPESADKVVHPFLGYVRNPAQPPPDNDTPPVDASGFRRWPDQESARDTFTIVIMGGSVAERFSYRARQTLLGELERRRVLPGRPKRILNYAMGGYKQPQQLAALAHLLSLGEHADIVVNLDGFNEIVLSAADNLRQGTHPLYPRLWAGLVQDVPDRTRLALIGESAYLRERRSELRRACDGVLLRHSALCRLAQESVDARLGRRLAAVTRRLEHSLGDQQGLEREGPPYPERHPEEVYAEVAAHWARCSVLMSRLCGASGIDYFHFLMPSQYVSGSKPMGEWERRVALRPSTGYGPFAVAGYPYLIAEGRSLPSRGVMYRDLTQIFRETGEPVYIDDCCHLNQRGNEILGREVARTIAERMLSANAAENPP